MYNSALRSGGCFRRFRKWPKRLVLGRFKFSLENAYVCAKIFSPRYLLEITLHPPEKLLPSPRVSTTVLPSIYIRTPFYLHTYSLLFTLGSCIIDILEKLNYHRDDTNLSSRWNVCIIMIKLIFHHDDNSISRLRKQWEYVYKWNGLRE